VRSVISYPLADLGLTQNEALNQRLDCICKDVPFRKDGGNILEIEVDEILIKYQKLNEDGKKPSVLREVKLYD
jgi:hypothetical protein